MLSERVVFPTPLSNVKQFVSRQRKIRTIEFKNVSLQVGRKTEVQVVASGTPSPDAPLSASLAPVSSPTFCPVIERTVNDPRHNPRDSAIDLDSGKLFSDPSKEWWRALRTRPPRYGNLPAYGRQPMASTPWASLTASPAGQWLALWVELICLPCGPMRRIGTRLRRRRSSRDCLRLSPNQSHEQQSCGLPRQICLPRMYCPPQAYQPPSFSKPAKAARASCKSLTLRKSPRP